MVETTHVVGSKWNFAWCVVFGVSHKRQVSSNLVKRFRRCGDRNLPSPIALAIGFYNILYGSPSRDTMFNINMKCTHTLHALEIVRGCACTTTVTKLVELNCLKENQYSLIFDLRSVHISLHTLKLIMNLSLSQDVNKGMIDLLVKAQNLTCS